MTAEEYFGGWTKVIDKAELNHVMSVLSKEYTNKPIYPNQADVFKAFKLCPFEDLKVVFLGQDFNK
jgi:uracil-DNA glycosylase